MNKLDSSLKAIIEAMNNGQEDTIALIEQATLEFPDNAALQFLLASELAQKQDTAQALKAFEKTVMLDPNMHIARYQYVFFAMVSQASIDYETHLNILLSLDESSYLLHFSAGIQFLLLDQEEKAIQAFRKGLELNNENIALNDDVRNIISLLSGEQTDEQPVVEDENTETEKQAETDVEKTSILLDIYKNQV
ncbi:hypothetical protein L1286_22400 [Pseudoalteromonas sp. SMS1]|uniref:hypothetical protein n=1 Tax=Pseudoalteromonas sp. SMS1 TaxID=2908894 RepID=UPI001F161DA2|nr:hypothetical protein [Pseudoalteromonas sp. SMS1]MCF2860236.1 hypothetical protein [Pseudoalteromonas sp. SMS1]